MSGFSKILELWWKKKKDKDHVPTIKERAKNKKFDDGKDSGDEKENKEYDYIEPVFTKTKEKIEDDDDPGAIKRRNNHPHSHDEEKQEEGVVRGRGGRGRRTLMSNPWRCEAPPVMEDSYFNKFEEDQNPTYKMYLEKATEIPEFMNEVKFLSKNVFEKVALTSFPRWGNTLLRKYFEEISRIKTGSDSNRTKKLVKDLVDSGFTGEGESDDKVWIVKTHFPDRFGPKKFQPQKCVLVVRNPFDAVLSLFNMVGTTTHNESIAEDEFEKVKEIYYEFLDNESLYWLKFHEYWLDPRCPIPIFVIRFEELTVNPKKVMTDVFCFLLNCTKEEMEGTLIELLISKACDKPTHEKQNLQAYKPRKGKTGLGKKVVPHEQYQYIKNMWGEMFRRLGYLKKPPNENNEAYFSEDEEITSCLNYGKSEVKFDPEIHTLQHGKMDDTDVYLAQKTAEEINEESLLAAKIWGEKVRKVSGGDKKLTSFEAVLNWDVFHDGVYKKPKADPYELIDARTVKGYLRSLLSTQVSS